MLDEICQKPCMYIGYMMCVIQLRALLKREKLES